MYSHSDDLFTDSDDYFDDTNESLCIELSSTRLQDIRNADRFQLLERRVNDLEEIVRKQHADLSEKDASYKVLRAQLKQLKDIKDRRIDDLARTVLKLQEKHHQLDAQIKVKNANLAQYQGKLNLLSEIINTSLPSVEDLVSNLRKLTLDTDDLDEHSQLDEEEDEQAVAPHDETADSIFETLTSASHLIAMRETCDSGHPSSASDSYNVPEDYEFISKHGLPSDVHSFMRPQIPTVVYEVNVECGERSPVKLNTPRDASPLMSKHVTGRDMPSSLEQRFNLPSPQKHFAPITSVLPTEEFSLSSQTAFAESEVEDIKDNQSSTLILPAIANAQCLSTFSFRIDDESNKRDCVLESRGNIHDDKNDKYDQSAVESATNEDEPPPPAPPPTTNPGNSNLPSIHIPKRFLPLLANRYNQSYQYPA